MPYADPEKAREYQRLWAQGWRAAHPKETAENVKRWQAKNRDKVRAYRKIANARRLKSGARREYQTGCSPAHFEALLAAQNGCCAICKETLVVGGRSKLSVTVDHSHATGRLRGLLCNKCNRALGLLGDNPDNAERAAVYLRKWAQDGASAPMYRTSGPIRRRGCKRALY